MVRAKKQKKSTQVSVSARVFATLFFLVAFAVLPAPVQAGEVDEIENDIEKLEKKLKSEEQKLESLNQDLGSIKSSLSKTQSLILRTQNLLRQTLSTIEAKEVEIANLENQLVLDRKILTTLVQELYLSGSTGPLVEVVLQKDDLSDFFSYGDNLLSTQERLEAVMAEMKDLQSKLGEEKAALVKAKKDHEELISIQNRQKQSLAFQQAETQEEVAEQQADINRLKRELAELQGDLSKILGKSYNAKDIKDAVEFASSKTGVPKGFLFGVLKMETNLGANVGGCTYKQVEDGAEKNYKSGRLSKTSWKTFLRRRDIFKSITDELDIDYKKQKVSCNPSGYRGTGGAMGVAQFMPDTWMGYKSAVASATGHHPPSPWNLTDGVMAMALKLDRVPGVDEGSRSAWKKAAAAYLGTSYKPYIDGILYWADHYKELL